MQGAETILRHSWAAYALAGGASIVGVVAVFDDPSPQTAFFVVLGTAGLVIAARGLVVVRDGVVRRRGLFGWRNSPLPLAELTAVRLRREASNRMWARELTLSTPHSEESFECWAWRGWRELAHVAGHAGAAVGAHMDDTTRRRVACDRGPGCPTASAFADTRPHGMPPPDTTVKSWGEVLAAAGLGTIVGFGFGAIGAWLRGDEELVSPLEGGLLAAAVLGIGVFLLAAWELLHRPR